MQLPEAMRTFSGHCQMETSRQGKPLLLVTAKYSPRFVRYMHMSCTAESWANANYHPNKHSSRYLTCQHAQVHMQALHTTTCTLRCTCSHTLSVYGDSPLESSGPIRAAGACYQWALVLSSEVKKKAGTLTPFVGPVQCSVHYGPKQHSTGQV